MYIKDYEAAISYGGLKKSFLKVILRMTVTITDSITLDHGLYFAYIIMTLEGSTDISTRQCYARLYLLDFANPNLEPPEPSVCP